MPKFNNREEYEAWKARKLAESGAKPAQQPKQPPAAPTQAVRPNQPQTPPAQQGRPLQRPAQPQQAARPAQPQRPGQGGRPARPGQPAQRPQSRQAGAGGGAQRQAPPRKAAPRSAGPETNNRQEPPPAGQTRSKTLDEIIAENPSLRPPGYKDRDEVPDNRTYLERVPEAFIYPFNGHGKYMLITGVIMMAVVGALSMSPLLAIILGIIVFGFMSSYMMKIIIHSSDGEEEAPDWPNVSEFGSDIIAPAFQLLWTLFVSYLPAIALMAYLWPLQGFQNQAIVLGAKLICTVYFPMALIVMSHGRSYLAVGPHIVLPAIFKVPGDYIIAVVVLQLALILKNVLEMALLHIPFLGWLITSFVSLYFIMASMHLLGLVYYKNREVLNWWGEY